MLMIKLINENALLLAKNVSIVSLILFLTSPALSVPDLILCIVMFVDDRKECCSYKGLLKNIYNFI